MNIRIKRLAASIGVGLLFLIALALAARAVLNITSGSKLKGVIQNMKSEGIPLTLQEIEPECDASNNAAISWKAAEVLFLVEKEKRNLLNTTIRDLFSRCPLSAERKMQLTEIISRDQKALQFLHEAWGRPCFKYNDSWDCTPSSLKIPDLPKLILIFRLHGVDCYLTAESGQVEEGIEMCFSGMSFLDAYLQEPFLINYLVAVSNMKTLLACLQRIVEEFPIDSSLSRKIIERLDHTHWRERLLWNFSVERILALEAAFGYLDGSLRYNEENAMDKISIWLFKPFLKSGMAKTLDALNAYERAISLPFYESRGSWEKFTQEFNRPIYIKLMNLLFPDYTTVMFKGATMEAMLHSIRLGLGCRIFKQERGNYPDSLEELTPEILDTVPVDPFTGKPFVYRVEDTGLIIYSVGNNLKDDEGRGTWMITKLVMEKDDDWAWKESFLK